MRLIPLDTFKLKADIAVATEHLRQALAAVHDVLASLTEKEREQLLRPPHRFPEAARSLARLALDAPDVAQRAEFDPVSVTRSVDNAAALSPIMEKIAELTQRVDDSKLLWLDEAYTPSLALHNIAKAGAKVDPSLAALVEPMKDIFTSRRKPAKRSAQVV